MTYYHPTNYVFQLPLEIRQGIERALRRNLSKKGHKGKNLEHYVQIGINSRLYSLDSQINVDYWLKKANKH